MCPSCLRGKWGATPLNRKTSHPDSEHYDVTKDRDLIPGDCVHTYQYECRVKGRLPNTRGREDPHKMYCGSTLFNDHASSKIGIFHQVSLGDPDNVRSKHVYEQRAADVGVKIIKYI